MLFGDSRIPTNVCLFVGRNKEHRIIKTCHSVTVPVVSWKRNMLMFLGVTKLTNEVKALNRMSAERAMLSHQTGRYHTYLSDHIFGISASFRKLLVAIGILVPQGYIFTPN